MTPADLEATLARLLSTTSLPPVERTEEFGGLGMDNVLLRATLVDGHQVLLRQGAPAPSPLARAEFLRAHDVGAPRVWAADETGAVLVDFVPGRSLVEVAEAGELDDPVWERLGRAFARVHAVRLPAPLCGPFAPDGLVLVPTDPVEVLFRRVDAAEAWVRGERPRLAPQLPVLRGRIAARASQLRAEVPCLTHGDANFHNIVLSDDGTVTLIDWDGPAVTHPLAELAGLEGHADLYGFPQLPPAFFAGYGRTVSAPLLRLHRIVGHLEPLSSPSWARMVSGQAGLSAELLAMVRRLHSGWSTWFDDLSEHLRAT